MVKYVLNSGGIKHDPEAKRRFHEELVKGVRESPHFLLCNFAQSREVWEEKFPKYQATIVEDLPKEIAANFTLAMPANFIDQCARADIIYFQGGDDHLIQYWMKHYDLPQLFEGKVVATNSASSDMLAKSFWTCDWRQSMYGLGVLPIKFIPHYQSAWGDNDPRGPINWQQAYDELAAYDDTSLPIHALKEGEFIVFE